ncbi:SUN domain-containing protein [Sergentomyia squamirostris]
MRQRVNIAQVTLGGRVVEAVGEFFDLYPCPDKALRGFLLYCRPVWKLLESKPLSSGDCVAFKGSEASFVIQLHSPAHIEGMTIEHIPYWDSPSGEITSAPKDFTMSAISSEGVEFFLDTFTYTIPGKTSQMFKLKVPTQQLFTKVKINFITNHGHPHYTCVYRIKIHGMFVVLN